MRLMIVPCAAAALALYVTIGTSERALAFGDQTRGSSGFQDQFGEQQGSVGEQRRTRTYRKRTPSVSSGAAGAQASPRETVQGNSREALYLRCRSAIYDKYAFTGVYEGRVRRLMYTDRLVGQIDACVMNGGKAI
jgi:hypothetical protein